MTGIGKGTGMAKRGLVLLLVLVLASAILGGCASAPSGGAGTSPAKEPIKVGAILSLTGTYAGLGGPEKQAIELEVKRINDAGGINGRPIEVLVEDDATDPQKAVAAATKLIDQEKVVAILGATGTGSTMAIRNEAARAGVPIVSMAGGSVITGTFDKNTFQTPWPNNLVVAFTLSALKDAGITKVALLSSSDGYGKDGRQVVLDTTKNGAAVTIVGDETFNPGDTDMTAQLTKLKATGPQAIWLWNAGKEAAIVAKNLRQIDPQGTIKLYGAPGNARKEFISGAGEAAEGFTFAAGKILVPETYGTDTAEYKVAKDFIDRFTKANGTAPDIFAGHAYDALAVTVDALKRAGDGADGPKVRDAIEGTKGLIGIGGTFTYSATDHNGLSENDLVLYRI
ncbi:MAG: ABC transporter substrate-binding protein, partial [Coriobacteriia bacterium]|nr:ABC transporter substrate-binding protein [Coriobacteriia bacterium]